MVRSPIRGHEQYAGRLAIPYIGPKGNIYDLRFRCLQPHDCKAADCPKYLGMPGVETRMFNTRALMARTDYLLVTEGEMDAITLTECGWPAVGVPGASAWKKHHGRMLAGFSKVVLIADGDEAGTKLASVFRRALPSVGHVMVAPEGQDVNAIYMTHGKAGLIALLNEREAE